MRQEALETYIEEIVQFLDRGIEENCEKSELNSRCLGRDSNQAHYEYNVRTLLFYLCLYNLLFALFHYVFKFLTPYNFKNNHFG